MATQAISTTGVEMDLNGIAQAERMYFAQNGSYATLDQLASSGTSTSRAPNATVTGMKWKRRPRVSPPPRATPTCRRTPPRTLRRALSGLSIDQNMQIQQGN